MQALWVLWKGQHKIRWCVRWVGVLPFWFYSFWWKICSFQEQRIQCHIFMSRVYTSSKRLVSSYIYSLVSIYFNSCYFFLIGKNRNILENGHLEENPKAYREYTKGPLRHKQKKRRYKTIPHLASSQSKKLSKGRGPSFTTDFVHTQRLQTKEFFQPMNRKVLIIECNPVSFHPNRPKKAQRGCLPHLSTLLAQHKAPPFNKGISSRKWEDPKHSKKGEQ